MGEENNVTELGGDIVRGVFLRVDLAGLVERAKGYDERTTVEGVLTSMAKSLRLSGYTIVEQDVENAKLEAFQMVSREMPLPKELLEDARKTIEAMGARIEVVEEQWRRQTERMIIEQAQINIADAILSHTFPGEVTEALGQVLLDMGYL